MLPRDGTIQRVVGTQPFQGFLCLWVCSVYLRGMASGQVPTTPLCLHNYQPCSIRVPLAMGGCIELWDYCTSQPHTHTHTHM